jgi:hypothetical protein
MKEGYIQQEDPLRLKKSEELNGLEAAQHKLLEDLSNSKSEAATDAALEALGDFVEANQQKMDQLKKELE